MDITQTVAKAGAELQKQIDAILAAEKNGTALPKDALRVGGIAAYVVKKGAAIESDPVKYQEAGAERTAGFTAMAQGADIRAKAEGFTRVRSAERALSLVNKVEEALEKMYAAPKPRGRKVRSLIGK